MPRDFLRRISPSEMHLRDNRYVRLFGSVLHDRQLWHLNRRTAAGGAAVGLFMCWVPMPTQMLMAATAAVLLRVNLPLAIAGVWITNPITVAPMFYFAYRLGLLITGSTGTVIEDSGGFEIWLAQFEQIWWPLVAGSTLLAISCSAIGYVTVSTLWRIHVMRKFRRRHLERRFNLHIPNAAEIREHLPFKGHAAHRHEAQGGSAPGKQDRDRESR